MATILEFRPRPVSPTPSSHAAEAEIILFPGIRYEMRDGGKELDAVSARQKAAET